MTTALHWQLDGFDNHVHARVRLLCVVPTTHNTAVNVMVKAKQVLQAEYRGTLVAVKRVLPSLLLGDAADGVAAPASTGSSSVASSELLFSRLMSLNGGSASTAGRQPSIQASESSEPRLSLEPWRVEEPRTGAWADAVSRGASAGRPAGRVSLGPAERRAVGLETGGLSMFQSWNTPRNRRSAEPTTTGCSDRVWGWSCGLRAGTGWRSPGWRRRYELRSDCVEEMRALSKLRCAHSSASRDNVDEGEGEGK